MAKSKLIIIYYNNVYQGWHEWWWTMSTFTLGQEKIKKVIIIYMVQEILHWLNKFGWFIVEYLYTLESTRKRNMGVFYGKNSRITTKCSSVNHKKITWEYETMVHST
jgi:hypothetical protein